jgi:hypothetical protein
MAARLEHNRNNVKRYFHIASAFAGMSEEEREE